MFFNCLYSNINCSLNLGDLDKALKQKRAKQTPIEEMVRSYGASTIEFTPSDRWEKGSVFDFIDEFGNDQKLEQSRIVDGYKV